MMCHSLEFAFRSVLAEHSDSPIYLVLPAFLISSNAGIDCSSGVSVHIIRQSHEAQVQRHETRKTYQDQSDANSTNRA